MYAVYRDRAQWAAVFIQTVARGRMARHYVQRYRLAANKSAGIIQRRVRGVLGRKDANMRRWEPQW